MRTSRPGTTRIVAGESQKPKRKRTLESAWLAGLVLLIGAGAAVASTCPADSQPPRPPPDAAGTGLQRS